MTEQSIFQSFCIKAENISQEFSAPAKRKNFIELGWSLISRRPIIKKIQALRNVSFEIEKGDRLALIGRIGAGKTTLLEILAGLRQPTSGKLLVNGRVNFMSHHYSGINGDLSVIENIYLLGAVYKMDRDFLRDKIEAIIDLAELNPWRFTPLKDISPGQHQRLALSIFFQSPGDILIFDENFWRLDENFKIKCQEFFRKLTDSGRTVIVSFHNNDFLKTHCRTAIWLEAGRIQMHGEVNQVLEAYELSLAPRPK